MGSAGCAAAAATPWGSSFTTPFSQAACRVTLGLCAAAPAPGVDSMRLIRLFALAPLVFTAAAHAATVIDRANGYTLNSKNELVRFDSFAFDDDGHVFGLGDMLNQLDLTSTATLADALKVTAVYARANPATPADNWLRGRGWNQEIWKLGRFPTAAELDAVVPDRPVWFERVDGHAGWANSAALKLAGITDGTPDPVGGKIIRDSKGHATGILVDGATALMEKVLPPQSEAGARASLDKALAEIARVGLTSVHDAGIPIEADALYRDYADHGKLTARIYAMIGGTEHDFDVLSAKGPLRSYANDMYMLRAVKLYSDGALGSRGAALIAPYSDEPTSHGLLFKTDAQMRAMMEKAMRKGYQVNVHAIGDAGNRQILDGYEELVSKTATSGLRHRIEHAQVVALSDIPRFRQIGVIPSM